jgi:hypothetical protein
VNGRLLTTREVAEHVSLSPETILRRSGGGATRCTARVECVAVLIDGRGGVARPVAVGERTKCGIGAPGELRPTLTTRSQTRAP